MTVLLPGNISLSDGRALTPKLENILRRTPEVVSVLSQLGRPEDGTDTKLPNNLEVFIKLKPMSEWRSDKHTMSDLIEEMSFALQQIPGIDYNFSQPIRDNVEENVSGQKGQVALKIYGEDLGQADHRRRKSARRDREDPGRGRRRHHEVGQYAANRRALGSPSLGALRSRSG